MQFANFLANSPPGSKEFIEDLIVHHPSRPWPIIATPDVNLDCESEQCDGIRCFECIDCPESQIESGRINYLFLHYRCRNCQKSIKTLAIIASDLAKGQTQTYGNVLKLGENPPFGPRVPARVIRLIEPDREWFFKGRRAENHGLGIGAFAYYRRIIENQKTRLFDEVIRAAERIGAPEEQIQALEAAKNEKQFNRAIEIMKGGFPAALLINGQNPLSLLYGPLSEGIHGMTDEQCLRFATDIREILFELADKIGEALKSKAGLDAAVSRLTRAKAPPVNKS